MAKKEDKKHMSCLDKLVKLEPNKFNIEVGLVEDRHNMPVDKFIFDSIDSDLMFNYQRMENIINDFIDKNITFDENGYSNELLTIYLTGLQCALSSAFKVCHNRHVNLRVMHYNTDTHKYASQDVINYGNRVIKRSPFEPLINSKESIYLYKCTEEEILELESFYSITKVLYLDNTRNIDKEELIFVKDFDSIWEIYPELVKEIRKDRTKGKAIFTASVTFNDGDIEWIEAISKSFNFK